MMKSIKNYCINIVIILFVSFLSIYFALHGNFKEITHAISELSLFSLLFLIILGLTPYFIEALVLKKFSNLYLPTYSFKDGYINALTGAFFSGITPFSSGGQFAQAYVFKRQGISYTHSTGILLMHFILYQICLVIYTLLIMLFKFKEMSILYNGFLSLAFIGFICNTAVIVGLLAAAMSYKVQYFITNTVLKIAYYLRVIKNYELSKKNFENYLVEFRCELKVIQQHPKEMLTISLLFILKLTILYSLPFIIMYTLGYSVPLNRFFDYFAVCAFIYLITAFIPIPGASGGSEGTYVLLFSALIGNILSRTSMLVWRFITYYVTVILGSVTFIRYTSKKKGEK